jgi:uncharacterized protein
MLVILSPAKKQDFTTPLTGVKYSQIQTKRECPLLLSELKALSQAQIKQLMGVSDAIAELNWQRFKAFDPDKYDLNNAKQAAYALKGDAYRAMDVGSLSMDEVAYMQQHLIILSGLYGYLRPLDLIQAYRLEMKTRLSNTRGEDLYQFWGDKISQGLNKALKKINSDTLINLASNEYFKAVNTDKIKANIVTAHFKELKNGECRSIGIHAKRARGTMTRFIMQKRIKSIAALKKFSLLDYQYNVALSDAHNLVFTRS